MMFLCYSDVTAHGSYRWPRFLSVRAIFFAIWGASFQRTIERRDQSMVASMGSLRWPPSRATFGELAEN